MRWNLFCRFVRRRTATIKIGRAADKVHALYGRLAVHRVVIRYEYRIARGLCRPVRGQLTVEGTTSRTVRFYDETEGEEVS